MENLLDEARRGEMQLNTDIINLFLETKDIMQEQLDAYKNPKSRMPQASNISAMRYASWRWRRKAKPRRRS